MTHSFFSLGTLLISALKEKRNCLCAVEKDPVLFIHSKIHVIEALKVTPVTDDNANIDNSN